MTSSTPGATFLHTADWQLGKPFARVEEERKRALLAQERLEALRRIGAAVGRAKATFVVVAGDLFDSTSVTKSTVAAALSLVGAMGVPVFAIPGNHDHGGPDGLWEQPFFLRERERLAPNFRILLAPEPVELDEAVLFPCPLLHRHETGDALAWLRAGIDLERFGDRPRVVLAHGSVQGFTSEDNGEDGDGTATNRLDLARLPEGAFDYIALGDWHGTKRVAPNAWYAGTPELDRFPKGEGNAPGNILAVTCHRAGLPDVAPLRTARFGWHRIAFDLAGDESLARLEERFAAAVGQRAGEDLLLLELSGSLGIEGAARLEERLESWRAQLLRLKLANRSVIAPTDAEVAALTDRPADPLIRKVALRLIERARGEGEQADVARLALRELHAACGRG